MLRLIGLILNVDSKTYVYYILHIFKIFKFIVTNSLSEKKKKKKIFCWNPNIQTWLKPVSKSALKTFVVPKYIFFSSVHLGNFNYVIMKLVEFWSRRMRRRRRWRWIGFNLDFGRIFLRIISES